MDTLNKCLVVRKWVCQEQGRSESVCVKHNCYHLLIVEDRLEPVQVLRLEWHQDHECAGLVVQSWVSNGRLGVEEPHGGLVSNVVLVSSHWRIVQPEAQIKYSSG